LSFTTEFRAREVSIKLILLGPTRFGLDIAKILKATEKTRKILAEAARKFV